MKTGKALDNIADNAEQKAVSRLANEFQTPLGVILSAGELLESYFERLTPDRRRLALEDILSSARQMNSTMALLTGLQNETKPKSATSEESTSSSQKRSPRNHHATRQATHSRL
jgi:signal transduction histidine kinase